MTIPAIDPDVLAVALSFGLDSALPAGRRQQSFLAFWAARWAPIGAKNDPNNLNANWPVTVGRLWSAL